MIYKNARRHDRFCRSFIIIYCNTRTMYIWVCKTFIYYIFFSFAILPPPPSRSSSLIARLLHQCSPARAEPSRDNLARVGTHIQRRYLMYVIYMYRLWPMDLRQDTREYGVHVYNIRVRYDSVGVGQPATNLA